jgi:ribose/xylose/arabinose/galactoside ABC-type transport system permease subunit
MDVVVAVVVGGLELLAASGDHLVEVLGEMQAEILPVEQVLLLLHIRRQHQAQL